MTGAGLGRAAALLGALAGVAGCAIQADSGPRDIPDDHPARVVIAPAVEGGEAEGSDRIYLIAPEGSPQPLRTVLRASTGPEQLMATLVRGPNPQEFSEGLRTEILPSFEIDVRFDGGVVNVDVSDDIDDLTESRLRLAIAQIVFTASELPGAESVAIRVEGEARSWLDGDGVLRSDPLTVYDFIGYAESSQPAYPVTPRTLSNAPPTTTTTTAPSTTVPDIATTAPSG